MDFQEALDEAKGINREKTSEALKYGKKFIEKKKEIANAIKKEHPNEQTNPYAIAWAVTKKMRRKGKI